MKKIYFIALFLISLSLFPQGAPKFINYQGVARNSAGDPITGPIAVRVEIHQGTLLGPVVCSEIFHLTTNQFGIFDLRIGSVSPAQFSAITWGSAKYFVGVAIDPSGGNIFGSDISNQELVSVPYALYAETAGNSGGSTTITSTFPSIVSVTSAAPSHTINYTPPQLKFNGDSLRIVQGAHTSSAIVISTSSSTPLGPWMFTSPSNVHLVNGTNNVGIGTSAPAAKLEVNANAFSTNNAIAAYAVDGNGILALTSSSVASAAAVSAQNSGFGYGVYGTAVSTSSNASGVYGKNSGSGSGVHGINSSGSSSPWAHGVVGETTSNNGTASGVYGVNNVAGPGVYGYVGSMSGGPGVFAVTNSTMEPGVHGISNNGTSGVLGEISSSNASPNANGVHGRTNSGSSTAAGVYGQNTGAGHGVMATTTSSSVTSYAVNARNLGQGEGIFGETGQTASNINAAVHGNQLGIGPGLRGTVPAGTVSGSSNAALMIENGHIWATTVNAPTFMVANNTGTTVGTASLVVNSNDVRGMFLLNVTTTNNWAYLGYFDFTLTFQKPYMSGGPWVSIAKYDSSNFIYEVITVTTTYVTFRIRNGSPGQLAPGPGNSQLRLMYMIMN